jgi:hypothetical protein
MFTVRFHLGDQEPVNSDRKPLAVKLPVASGDGGPGEDIYHITRKSLEVAPRAN